MHIFLFVLILIKNLKILYSNVNCGAYLDQRHFYTIGQSRQRTSKSEQGSIKECGCHSVIDRKKYPFLETVSPSKLPLYFSFHSWLILQRFPNFVNKFFYKWTFATDESIVDYLEGERDERNYQNMKVFLQLVILIIKWHKYGFKNKFLNQIHNI